MPHLGEATQYLGEAAEFSFKLSLPDSRLYCALKWHVGICGFRGFVQNRSSGWRRTGGPASVQGAALRKRTAEFRRWLNPLSRPEHPTATDAKEFGIG